MKQGNVIEEEEGRAGLAKLLGKGRAEASSVPEKGSW